MERKWLEKTGKMSNEELLRMIQRGRMFAIETAKEAIRRFEREDPKINENYLCAILEFKSSAKTEKEAKEIKEKIAMVVVERYLNERGFLTILHQDEIGMDKKEFTANKYLEKGEVNNYGLRKIIEILPSLRKRAIEKLWSQKNLSEDDLLAIVEYGEGEIQIKAFNKLWKKMKGEDMAYLISEGIMAEIIWRRIKAEKRMGDLENEDLVDIARYTNYQNIKTGSLRELWFKRRKSLDEDGLKFVVDNAHLISKNPEKIRNEMAGMLSMKKRSISVEEILLPKDIVSQI